MWRMAAVVGLLVFGAHVVWANPGEGSPEPFFGTPKAAGVLQNPGGAVSSVQSATATLQPSIEEFYDFRHSSWSTGSTVDLWTFSAKQVPIASLRAGYAAKATVLGEVKIDAKGITKSYLVPLVPASAKALLTAGVLNDAWGLVGKYGHVAAFAGWDLERQDANDRMGGIVYGISLGGSF